MHAQKRTEMKMLKDILQKLHDDEKTKFEKEIKDVTRVGKYEIQVTRPMNVTLKSQAVTEEIF